MKRATFSDHASRQLHERVLHEAQILDVVREPEEVVESGTRMIAQKIIYEQNKPYLLRVVYEEQADRLHIITVYRTSKITKYRSAQ